MAVDNNLRLFLEYIEYKKEQGVTVEVYKKSGMKYIEAICENVEQRIANLEEGRKLLKDNYISVNKLVHDGVGSASTLTTRNPLLGDFIKYLSEKYNVNPSEFSYGNTPTEKKDYYDYLVRQVSDYVTLDVERNELKMKVEDLQNQCARLFSENAAYKREVKDLRQKLGKQPSGRDDNTIDISTWQNE